MSILIFGDSITQGAWDENGGWVNRVRQCYDQSYFENQNNDSPTVFNLGVDGDCSDDLVMRLSNEATARQRYGVDAIVISIGINNSVVESAMERSTTESFKQDLAEILMQSRNYTNDILFVGLSPCDETKTTPVPWGEKHFTNSRIKEFDMALKEFCHENKLPFVEIFEPFSKAQQESNLLQDGLHPNSAGHQLIANLVKPELDKLIKQ